jgi:hypothetical protein
MCYCAGVARCFRGMQNPSEIVDHSHLVMVACLLRVIDIEIKKLMTERSCVFIVRCKTGSNGFLTFASPPVDESRPVSIRELQVTN